MDLILLGIKAQVAIFLTDRCTIASEVASSDEFGAALHTMQTVATDVQCRLIRGDKVRLADFGLQETSRETYRFIVLPTVILEKGQRITIDTSTYDVMGLRQNLTDGMFNEALVGRLA